MRTWVRMAMVGSWFCLVSTLTTWGESGLARHKKMYVTPAPAKIVVDGKFDDWDLSGQLQMFVVSETAEMQGARFALMYDQDALYISGDVRDTSPMMNRHDPKAAGDWGWDADCCQLRLVLDASQPYPAKGSTYTPREQNKNDQMAHMTLWYFTDGKIPVLHLQFGMAYDLPKAGYGPFGIVPNDQYEAVYRKTDDGRGYTFEYRVPWTTLEAKRPPKGGDLVAGTVQFNWSEPGGMKTAGGAAWAYDVMLGPGFTFQNAGCWGKVIFAEKGNLPKELVEEGLPPERQLPLTFEYDMPEDGEVTVALVGADAVIARSLVCQGQRRVGKNIERWDGLDDAGKPLPAGTYAWKGLYHGPITTKYLFSVHNSGQPGHKTDDNTGGWGGDHGWPNTVCPVPGGMLLGWHCCESGWGTIRVDLTGKKLWGNKHNAHHFVTDGTRYYVVGDEGYQGANSVLAFDLKDGCPSPWGNGQAALLPPAGGEPKTSVSTGIAYQDGKLYVAWKALNAVGIYDVKSGDLKETWTVAAPSALAMQADGTLLVVSEDPAAAEADRKNRFKPEPVVAPAYGGKVLAVKKGQATPLCVDHLDQPYGVATDKDGRIYVSNWGKLNNVSVFGPDGKFERSIGKEGGRPRMGRYDGSGMLRPAGIGIDEQGRLWAAEHILYPKRMSVWDTKTGQFAKEFFGGSWYSSHAWVDAEKPEEVYCDGVIWKVDYDKKTWEPYSTIWYGNPYLDFDTVTSEGSHYGGFRAFTARNGRQYAWAASQGNVLFIRQGDIYKPFLSAFVSVRGNEYIPWPPYPFMSDLAKYPNGYYVWADGNDDGKIQEQEVKQATDHPDKPAGWCWVDKDLNLWGGDGRIYRPQKVGPDGKPVYDFMVTNQVPVKGNNGQLPLMTDAEDGAIYMNGPTWDVKSRDIGYARYTPDGKTLQWGYRGAIAWPRAMDKPPAQPGKLWGPTAQLGTAGDYTGLAMYFGTFHIFDRKEGLLVAMLFKDSRTSGGLGPDVNACETFTGQLVKPKGMNRYFLLNGDQDGRVSEVFGLDGVKRLKGGAYEHTAEAEQKATAALTEYERLLAKGQRLDIGRGPDSLKQTKGITKFIDPQRNFTVHAAYDEKNLYVRYDVTSAFELINGSSDPRLVFKGGNLLDIQIAADPSSDPQRKKPAAGDVRLLVSRQGGGADAKPLVVMYQPKVKDFKGEPIVLVSPTGKEPFDAIQKTDRVGLEYQKTDGGFTAVVTIPFDLIGWAHKPGTTVKMDVGYLFGNAGGTQVALRSYWSNNSFSANVVNDVPNESRLEPGEWGTASVE